MKKKIIKKSLSFVLALIMILSIVPLAKVESNAFTVRDTAPSTSSIYYYSNNNPFYRDGYGMPNCTCYAWGRAYEVLGSRPNLSTGNAGAWYSYNKNNNYYPYSDTVPKAGAIACWAGHVAFVESVNENGTVNISQSNYGGPLFEYKQNIDVYNAIYYAEKDANGNLVKQPFYGYIYVCCSDEPHTHNYNTFVYYGKSHPHYNYYKCSCGDIQPNYNEKVFLGTCSECVKTIEEGYYAIYNPFYKDYITLSSENIQNNTTVTSSGSFDPDRQIFHIVSGSVNNSYLLKPKQNENYVISVENNSTDLSSLRNIVLNEYTNTAQCWWLGEGNGYNNTNTFVIRNTVNSYGGISRMTDSPCVLYNKTTLSGYSFIFLKVLNITYDSNGGDNISLSQVKYQGKNINISTEIPTRHCYTFLGWSTNPNATEPEYLSGGEFAIDEDTTLYAVWSSDFEYDTFGENLTLTSYNGEEETLIIPETIDSKPITEIGDTAFIKCTGIKSITLPERLEKIGDYAFSRCTNLESVTIPASVTEIGINIFSRCPAFNTVYGYLDTAAQAYAEDNGYNFIYLDTIVAGDMNKDGECDFTDYAMMKTYVSSSDIQLTNYQKISTDINSDGAYDAFDLFYIDKIVNSLV
ncbi:MAG TPA: hypothetical protein DCR23_03170 [Ruminococcaceae bacterium]|nr:hypothetical protein [Oscillospiraceae bacterium]